MPAASNVILCHNVQPITGDVQASFATIDYQINQFPQTYYQDSLETNVYSVGTWNANGWTAKTRLENINFKKSIVISLDLSIYILTELHCFKEDVLTRDGFTVYQYNQSKVSCNAVKGSGGVHCYCNK